MGPMELLAYLAKQDQPRQLDPEEMERISGAGVAAFRAEVLAGPEHPIVSPIAPLVALAEHSSVEVEEDAPPPRLPPDMPKMVPVNPGGGRRR